jgi:hypothetical protein
MPLSLKAKRFVLYYTGSCKGNATAAARKAGYAQPRMAGSRLMTNDDIRAAVEGRTEALAMEQGEVLIRMAELAAGDIGEFLAIKGDAWKVDIRKVKRHGYLVRRIRATKDGPELELESRFAALVKLGEYFGLWNREAPPAISLVELAKRLRDKAKEDPQP